MKKTRGREGESPRRVGGSEGLRAEDADTNTNPFAPRDEDDAAGREGSAARMRISCRCWGDRKRLVCRNGFPGFAPRVLGIVAVAQPEHPRRLRGRILLPACNAPPPTHTHTHSRFDFELVSNQTVSQRGGLYLLKKENHFRNKMLRSCPSTKIRPKGTRKKR